MAVLCDQEDVVEFLLQRGADINVRADDENAGAPLHWAAFFGNYDMVELLVEAGADVNTTDAFGCTPLDSALAPWEGVDQATKDQIADYLRANGGVTGD